MRRISSISNSLRKFSIMKTRGVKDTTSKDSGTGSFDWHFSLGPSQCLEKYIGKTSIWKETFLNRNL